jgi:hypothetical protein
MIKGMEYSCAGAGNTNKCLKIYLKPGGLCAFPLRSPRETLVPEFII